MFVKLLDIFKIGNQRRFMAVFTQILNPITGQNAWAAQNDSYDYHQEVANTGFGDMLHDSERNWKYYQALKKSIEKIHREGKEAHVLDIGTGTGILSMMAVKSGADSVTACEAFMPMANCAEKILEANGMKSNVTLIKKRSTDIIVGRDMARRANLLVTEVLDTELIGEGAIGIYNHAHSDLLTDDAICIPSRATCYAQITQSSLAAQWNSLKMLTNLDGEVLLKSPKEITECQGEANLHDVQLSQLPLDLFHPITQPLEIFEFDFSSKKPIPTERSCNVVTKSVATGSTDLVFYFWDIKMDEDGEIILSCAPFWCHPDFKSLAATSCPNTPKPNVVPWRDHWMQAIYYVPKPANVHRVGEEITLNCNHDEYSLWFDVFLKGDEKRSITRHQCSCLLHMTYPRSRIGQINQGVRNKKYMRYLEEVIDKDAQVLVLGDCCHIGMACSPLGAKEVLCYEPHQRSRHFAKSIAKSNNLQNIEFVGKLEDLPKNTIQALTHVFAEPFFLTSILPWDNFYFGTLLMNIKEMLPASTKISPHSARIYGVPVEFLDLHKIRKPVKECEGFDLTLFDEMVEKSMTLAQSKVEAQPLWEYPCKALSQPHLLLEVDFMTFDRDQTLCGKIPIEFSSSCNGVALWVDWLIDNKGSNISCVSSGPSMPIEVGEYIKWDMFVRQGVHLIGRDMKVASGKSHVQWNVVFEPTQGVLDFNFNVHI